MSDWRADVSRFKYRRSPLQEALCEFGFAPSEGFGPETIAVFQSALADRYPLRRSLKTISGKIIVNPDTVEQGIVHGERVQLLSEDHLSLVQINKDLLVINQLHPYPTWSAFKPSILSALDVFQSTFKPGPIFRAHLRYINRLDFVEPSVALGDWFEFGLEGPAVADSMTTVGFSVTAQFEYETDGRVKITLADTVSDDSALRCILDIEYISADESVLTSNNIDLWLDEAHSRVESAWLGCITQALHERCEPEHF